MGFALRAFAYVVLLTLLTRGIFAAEPLDTLYRLQNAERTSRGLPALGRGTKMQAVAQAHADWMVRTGQFTHFGNGTPWSRLSAAGVKYSAASENIAWGHPTPAVAIWGWMESPGHRANILGDYTHAGAGVALGRDGRLWWVMTFAKQTGAATAPRQPAGENRVAAPTLQGAVCRPGMPCAKPAKQPARRGLFGRCG